MQRGGSWTNSDLTGKGKGWMNTGFGMYAFNDGKAKTAKANKFDKMYNPGSKRDGFSVGIFGEAGALDWTGRGARSGGGAEAEPPRARRRVRARAEKRHLGGHADVARRRRRGPRRSSNRTGGAAAARPRSTWPRPRRRRRSSSASSRFVARLFPRRHCTLQSSLYHITVTGAWGRRRWRGGDASRTSPPSPSPRH